MSEPEAVAKLRVESQGRYDLEELSVQEGREIVAYIDAIVAERDAAVRELEDNAKQYAMLSDGYDTATDEIEKLTARLAACERVVEQLRVLRAPSLCCDGENNDEVDAFREGYTSALDDMRDILRAAVAAETQGEKDA